MKFSEVFKNVRRKVMPNILFGNAWKNVVVQTTAPGIIRDTLLSDFIDGGYLKVVHLNDKYFDHRLNINFSEHLKNVVNPARTLEDGMIGFPIIYNKFTIGLSEKVNVLSGFNEMEYTVATGAEPKKASISGYILPRNSLYQQYSPAQYVDTFGPIGETASVGLNYAEELLNTPPPNPNPILALYNDKMRISKSIKGGKKLIITGPAGLQIEAQVLGLNIDMSAEMSSVLSFSMNLLVTKIQTTSSNVIFLSKDISIGI